MNEIDVPGLIASVLVFGVFLGIAGALAVNLGYHAMQLFFEWRARRAESKAASESEDVGDLFEVVEQESILEGDHSPDKAFLNPGLILDERRKAPAVISIARRLGVTTVKALRIHDESLETDPDEHDGCPVCRLA